MLLKLLFSVNCQATAAYRAIRSLHFPHSRVHHTMNYIISPHMYVRHTVRNVGLPHLEFLFPVGLPPSYHSLKGYLYLLFPSLLGPPHSELHYSPSHVGPSHCEKCGSATSSLSLSGGSTTFLTL